MNIKQRLAMLLVAFALSGSLYNCEIINENSSPFDLVSRNGTVPSDTSERVDIGGQTQVTDSWVNTQLNYSSAVIAFVLDASGSFATARATLIEEGIPKVVEYFGNQNIDACFMVLGGYADNPNNPNFPIESRHARVTLGNGTVLNNPAGVPLSSDNSTNNQCVCVNEYGSVDALVSQVKANAAIIRQELLGVGETLIESASALLTKPEVLNPLISAGECMQPEQQTYFVLAGDETSPILRPKTGVDYNFAVDGFSYSTVNFGNRDDDLYLNATVNAEAGWDTRTGMAFADWNSVTDEWDINRTKEDYHDIFRTFFGALPGGFISIGYAEEGGPGQPNEPGTYTHKTKAVAEMNMVTEFHDNLDDFQVPIDYLLGSTKNIPAFVQEFEILADRLTSVAQYQATFDTEKRCEGTLEVKGDGNVINASQIIEVSDKRFTIRSPHNQVTNVQAKYILNDGPDACDS